MKKWMLLLCAGGAVSALVMAGCATGPQEPDVENLVATVRLTKTEVVSVEKFRQKVEALEARTGSPASVKERETLLDLLVSEILIDQAAAKWNITASQAEMDARIIQAKQTAAAQINLNRELTDTEFRSLLQQSGMSWEEYQQQLKQAIIQQKYVVGRNRAVFEKIPQPTDREIWDFYESNKTVFITPDMVRFQHIFIDTRNLASPADKANARRRADDVERELRSGVPFGELVVEHSDDSISRYKGGDFGYLRRDDQAREQLLGREFFETPFRMEVGEVSGVLASDLGFHIIKIKEKIPSKLLELDDPIPPQNTTTVRQQIRTQLLQRKQAEYYHQALAEVIDELKKKADIKVFPENLVW